ncbi:putative transcriptional regulatory protein [Caenispirillum salinarum AK4]|uniref:Putative transcriptional regulatory protein n=1 Tax=Caenispirillum salinarum AK4 TaxID=1238182 RepID=K9HML8_9PROT|nr:response regulator [Caenispirillum salinarum]EKV31558.1 putative transcriptional regulatory protein [Caenispirillum salinarum AK4]
MVQTPHQEPPPLVYVVDDDDALRDSLTWLIRSADYEVAAYDSADAFVGAFRDERPACLLLDVRMPGMSGLELQEALRLRGMTVPIIFITGHGDVPMAVRALKAGAFDFVEKPFDDRVVLDRIQAAVDVHRERLAERDHHDSLLRRWRTLTPRERQTLRKVADGLQNKVIAHELDISQKTVEVHRHNGLEKMACTSAADLARMLMTLGDAARDDAS